MRKIPALPSAPTLPALRAAVVAALCLWQGPAQAADRDGNYAVWGAAGKSCHTFNSRDEAGSESYRQYVMGYLTAYNALAEGTYSISADLNLDGVMTWLHDYCQAKPMHSFDQALADFTSSHVPSRLTQPPGRIGW